MSGDEDEPEASIVERNGGDNGDRERRVELPDPFTGGSGPSRSLPGGRTLAGIGLALALVVLLVLWIARSWIHPFVYGVFFRNPSVVQWLIVGVILGAVGLATYQRRPILGRLALVLAVVSLVLVFVGPIVGGEYANVHLAGEVESEVTDLAELPDTTTDKPRILPASVAEQYAQNSLQFPRHSLARGDITFRDGTPHWSYALQPDGLVNTFIGKQAGAVFVDMTTEGKRVSVTESEFACGQGQLITDDYLWNLRKSRYTVDYQDPFMIETGDELVMAVPYVTHEHQFRATPLPQVYSVPRFGGVALVDENCEITHLSPEEARTNEVLDGQRYYPYDLALLRVNAMQYQNGILNRWFTHRDQLQIADLPGEDNDQPFTVITREGITYVVAAEPWGDASGIYQLWTIDARTGEMARFRTNVQNAMLGPQKAANYVEQDNPRVNWGSMSPSEPLPVVRNGTLWWEVRVVPDSSAGVTYTAFVNADTGDVIRYERDDDVSAFIAGRGDIDGVGGGAGGTDGTGGPAGAGDGWVVVIVDEDGTVVRTVTVGENQSVRIERPENRTAAAG